MARADPCPKPLGRPLLGALAAGPEVCLEAAETTEAARATTKGSQGRDQIKVTEDLQAAPGLLEADPEVVRAMAAADQGRLTREVVVARTLGTTTTHQVEDLIRQVEAVVAADKIRPGDEC